jgi:hypothetical protein
MLGVCPPTRSLPVLSPLLRLWHATVLSFLLCLAAPPPASRGMVQSRITWGEGCGLLGGQSGALAAFAGVPSSGLRGWRDAGPKSSRLCPPGRGRHLRRGAARAAGGWARAEAQMGLQVQAGLRVQVWRGGREWGTPGRGEHLLQDLWFCPRESGCIPDRWAPSSVDLGLAGTRTSFRETHVSSEWLGVFRAHSPVWVIVFELPVPASRIQNSLGEKFKRPFAWCPWHCLPSNQVLSLKEVPSGSSAEEAGAPVVSPRPVVGTPVPWPFPQASHRLNCGRQGPALTLSFYTRGSRPGVRKASQRSHYCLMKHS